MARTTPLDATSETLERLLEGARDGRIQIPEFQRPLILEDEWVKSLLASVSLGYPIGAVMLLQAGNPDVRFAASLIPGVPSSSIEPELLLVDGQRRLTALYQILLSGKPMRTQGGHDELIDLWYYLDVNAALDPAADRDEAVLSVSESGELLTPHAVMLDLGTVESEWERCLFPLRLALGDDGERRRWQRGFVEYGSRGDAGGRGRLMDRLEGEVLAAFEGYVVPTIMLSKETARWSVRVHGGPAGRSLSDRFRNRSQDSRPRDR